MISTIWLFLKKEKNCVTIFQNDKVCILLFKWLLKNITLQSNWSETDFEKYFSGFYSCCLHYWRLLDAGMWIHVAISNRWKVFLIVTSYLFEVHSLSFAVATSGSQHICVGSNHIHLKLGIHLAYANGQTPANAFMQMHLVCHPDSFMHLQQRPHMTNQTHFSSTLSEIQVNILWHLLIYYQNSKQWLTRTMHYCF